MIAASVQVYWLVLPLVAAISVVYSASRHEAWPQIWSSFAQAGSLHRRPPSSPPRRFSF